MHFFVKLSPSFVCLYVLHWQSVYHSKTQGREYRNCIVFKQLWRRFVRVLRCLSVGELSHLGHLRPNRQCPRYSFSEGIVVEF